MVERKLFRVGPFEMIPKTEKQLAANRAAQARYRARIRSIPWKRGRYLAKMRRTSLKHRKKCLEYYRNLRREAMEHYGGAICACCGETVFRMLTIDHTRRNGAAHRRRLKIEKRGNRTFFYWLRNKKYPPGFRVLCWNCNIASYWNGGVCPHKEERGV